MYKKNYSLPRGNSISSMGLNKAVLCAPASLFVFVTTLSGDEEGQLLYFPLPSNQCVARDRGYRTEADCDVEVHPH